jgi:ribosomal protein S7
VCSSYLNSSPFFYIKKIQRKKKKALEFPFLLKNSLKLPYGIKVILLSARIKSTFSFYKKCSLEIINSSKLMSEGVKKKKETYKTAFFTKRYANYRWF